MQTIRSWLERSDGTQRRWISKRWGLLTVSPPVMEALLRTPRVAQRSSRRLAELGAARILRLLAELAGHTLPHHPRLVHEAAELRRWGLLPEVEEQWALPADLCLALQRPTDTERLFTATLLHRLPEPEIRALAIRLGIRATGHPLGCILRIVAHQHAQDLPRTPKLLAAARTTEDLQHIPGREFRSLGHDVIDGALLVHLQLTDGRTLHVLPREQAARLGAFFMPIDIDGMENIFQPNAPTIRIPTVIPTSAILHFSTARAAEHILQTPEIRPLIGMRLDERTVALAHGICPEVACRKLRAAGLPDAHILQASDLLEHASA